MDEYCLFLHGIDLPSRGIITGTTILLLSVMAAIAIPLWRPNRVS